jgi:hypothetical protein
MKEIEHDIEALIRRLKLHEHDERHREVRLSQDERMTLITALRIALEQEKLG